MAGGRQMFLIQGPAGPREWEAKHRAVLPGLCNQNTEGTTDFPQRGGAGGKRQGRRTQRHWHWGHKLDSANVLVLQGWANYWHLVLPWLICTLGFRGNSASAGRGLHCWGSFSGSGQNTKGIRISWAEHFRRCRFPGPIRSTESEPLGQLMARESACSKVSPSSRYAHWCLSRARGARFHLCWKPRCFSKTSRCISKWCPASSDRSGDQRPPRS